MTPRILIVEDNLPFAINIESYLEEWGYTVTGIAENGKTALWHIVNDQPDLILMDIHINGNVSGMDIALAVKDQNIPIIFITGERDENMYESAKNTRAVSYLVKPFDMLTLKAAIELNIPSPSPE
ncbi:MAG: response regulator, partial [Bacteroidetes bacterium]